MLPSVDVRFRNMMKAMQEVVAPAIPADQKLAQEQVRLIVGHLTMLKDQWKDAVRYEAGSFRMMRELTEALASEVDDEQAAGLRAALAQVADIDIYDIDALNAGICAVGAAVDKVILGEEGSKPLPRGAWDVILAYGEKDALRSRVWFKGNGIDPDRDKLPPLETVL
ncbi:MAG: hypothetical protein WCY92_11950 [Novosphingobium sp.]